jgi:hypothetical protein
MSRPQNLSPLFFHFSSGSLRWLVVCVLVLHTLKWSHWPPLRAPQGTGADKETSATLCLSAMLWRHSFLRLNLIFRYEAYFDQADVRVLLWIYIRRSLLGSKTSDNTNINGWTWTRSPSVRAVQNLQHVLALLPEPVKIMLISTMKQDLA